MASPTPGKTSLGLEPNLAGLLCYLPCCAVGLIFSIVAVIVEKQNRFLRFHAFQSLLLHAVSLVLFGGLWFVGLLLAFTHLGFLSFLLLGLEVILGLGMLVVIILCMIKAYGNEQYELPMIGDMANKWA